MTLELYNLKRHAEKLRKEIADWDHKDAEYLMDLLIEFSETKDDLEFEGIYIEDIDGSNLPSENFPDNFDTSEYWALDKNGFALVGECWTKEDLSIVKIEVD